MNRWSEPHAGTIGGASSGVVPVSDPVACPFCASEATEISRGHQDRWIAIHCPACGEFVFSSKALDGIGTRYGDPTTLEVVREHIRYAPADRLAVFARRSTGGAEPFRMDYSDRSKF